MEQTHPHEEIAIARLLSGRRKTAKTRAIFQQNGTDKIR
jgi:hypothetical protein